MPSSKPPEFYKYLNPDSTTAVLSGRTLKWSSPPMLNDPFDVQTQLILEIDEDVVLNRASEIIAGYLCAKSQLEPVNDVGHAFRIMKLHGQKLSSNEVRRDFGGALSESMRRLQKTLPGFCDEIISGLKSSKLLCLSARRTTSTMWSHYAQNHEGAVLGFQAEEGVDSAFLMAKPINYSDVPPAFTTNDELAKVLAGFSDFGILETLEKFWYSKSSEWSYEYEWRICAGDGRDRSASFEYARFHDSDLKSLTFGLRSSPQNKTQWTELAKEINPKIELFELRQHGYEMSLVPIGR